MVDFHYLTLILQRHEQHTCHRYDRHREFHSFG